MVLATINPPAVVAIPHRHPVYKGSMMGPPPIPVPHRMVHTRGTTGPHIAVPGQWHHTSESAAGTLRAGGHSAVGLGYTAQHVQYGTERERWAKMSYVMPPAETISLEISAVHEGPGRRKGRHGVSFGVCYVPWSRVKMEKADKTFRIFAREKRMSMHVSMLLASSRSRWILYCQRFSPSVLNSSGVLKSLWYEMENG
jgi:hypothetical protein